MYKINYDWNLKSFIFCSDSFISIKFENDGNASWEKKAVVTKVCVDNKNNTTNSTCKKQQSPITSNTSIVEHNSAKSSLRWRKRIGHLFHVIKLRSGSSTSSCHVAPSKVEGAKVRKQGWMVRTLTRRKSRKSKSWIFLIINLITLLRIFFYIYFFFSLIFGLVVFSMIDASVWRRIMWKFFL